MIDVEYQALQSARGVYIVYPERRQIAASKISVWYSDAVANGDITDEDYLNIPDGQWQRQARALDDAGLITVSGAAF